MSEKTEQQNGETQDGEETPKKKVTKWEAVPVGVKASVQSNVPRSYLDSSMNTDSHAIKGKEQKENWQRIQRTTFTNWINNRLQGAKKKQ